MSGASRRAGRARGRCAGRAPGRSAAARRRCGRCPCDSRTAGWRRRLAGDEDRLIAVAAGLDAALAEADRAALAALAVADARVGLEVLEVQPLLATVRRAERSAHRVEQPGRPAQERLALAPVGAQRVECRAAPSRRCSPVMRTCSAVAGVGGLQLARARRAKITPSAVREQCTCTTSRSRPVAASARSMLMIGVMPLPALMNSSRAGSGSGSTNVPSTPPSRTIVPGRTRVNRNGETLPPSHELGRDRDAAVRAARVGGQRVGAPVVDAVDGDAQPQVLSRTVAGPLPAGLDQDGHRFGRLALDALDAAAQLARRPQRVDELQIVVGQQRRGERADEPQRAPARPAETCGTAPRSAIGSGSGESGE